MTSTSVRLGDIAEFVRGINFKPGDVHSLDVPGAVACLRTKNVQTELDLTDVWGVHERFVKRPEQFLREGDVLVSSANSWNLVGRCSWVPWLPWRTTFGGFVSVLRADQTRVVPRFLFHLFASERIQTIVRSFGQQTTNISNLNIERCLALPVRLPCLREQQRVATILDKADRLRDKRRTALKQLDLLSQYIFLEMFGEPISNPRQWPLTRLDDLADQITDGEHLTPRRASSGIKLLSARNIRDGHLDFTDVDYIDQSEYERLRRRCAPVRGDVLISCSGTIGRVAVVNTSEPLSLVRSAALVRPRANVLDPTFLEHYLRTPAMKSKMVRRANASSQANLFQGQIRDLPIYVPPFGEQRVFAERLRAVGGIRRKMEVSLRSLDELFASLQHRAFRGEL